jgi:hypothetical protein
MLISPFRSECLDSEEEDGPGPGLDFSGLHDPEAMLQFLFACDDLLFDGSNDYNSDKEGYDPTRECFHVGHEEHGEGNHLGMPWEDNAPAPPLHAGVAQTPAGSHIAHLEQLRELHTKIGEEQQRLQVYNNFGKFLSRKSQVEPLTREHMPRLMMSIVASW